MKKKLLALSLCLVMVVAAVCVLVACDKDKDYDYEITVWVGEGMKDLTIQQINAFNETNQFGIKFKATVEIQSEKSSIGNMEGKPASSWPDIFCFAQDQLARAVKGKMLQKLSGSIVTQIEENNSDETIDAAKIGDTVCAFPMTADNGYFMYYDKRVVSEEHKGSLEAIISDVEAYTDASGLGRRISMNLTKAGGGWYAASFFYATGCKSEWVTNEDGYFTDFADTFKSDEGVIALQGMQKLLKSSVHWDSDSTADFNAGVPSAVVISGIWDYNTALNALGDNLGIAPLPKFTVGETSYQLQSYLGHKFMGVKPQSDAHRAAYLQQLAAYLTNADCQRARFELSGWGPANKTLTNLTSPALASLKQTATVMQGQYPDSWWSDVLLMTGNAKDASSDAATLMGLLTTYNTGLSNYVK